MVDFLRNFTWWVFYAGVFSVYIGSDGEKVRSSNFDLAVLGEESQNTTPQNTYSSENLSTEIYRFSNIQRKLKSVEVQTNIDASKIWALSLGNSLHIKDDAAGLQPAIGEITHEASLRAPGDEQSSDVPSSRRESRDILYFDFDSNQLSRQTVGKLDDLVGELLADEDKKLRLEGHTDERGTRTYNMLSSERRANAVRDYLVANGVSSRRIEVVAFGEERPLTYGSGEDVWDENRRVEVIVLN